MGNRNRDRNKNGKDKRKESEENLENGIRLLEQSSLFGKMLGRIVVCGKGELGVTLCSVAGSDGNILVNRDVLMAPKQWQYILAHQYLHLAFGHFDRDCMPDSIKADQDEKLNIHVWNMACDLYITKFLTDIKFGDSPFSTNMSGLIKAGADEREIYESLLNFENWPDQLGEYEASVLKTVRMKGLEHPIIYGEKEKNWYAEAFARALADSVTEAVSQASGMEAASGVRTETARAADWFLNHFPLLGGLAAGFQIVENTEVCRRFEIQTAAVDVAEGIVYINPAARLDREELKFVLAHEYLHAGLMHHERCQGRNAYLWNVACDYVINGWLVEMETGRMPQGVLYDETLKNCSAEAVYDRIFGDMRKYAGNNTLRGYGKGDVIFDGSVSVGKKHPGTSLDEFCRNALAQGLEYCREHPRRGVIPAGLEEEIRALAMPPVPWDVKLARWFDSFLPPLERCRSYARPSRRQSATPDIPRPRSVPAGIQENARTFGVVLDTSGSMEKELLGMALGSIASFAAAREVPYVRVVFCDAGAYDAGYLAPEEIAGRVIVKGRGGTVLQPGVDKLLQAEDFPKDGPILVITDGFIEGHLHIPRKHAFLIPRGRWLPFSVKGDVFYFH